MRKQASFNDASSHTLFPDPPLTLQLDSAPDLSSSSSSSSSLRSFEVGRITQINHLQNAPPKWAQPATRRCKVRSCPNPRCNLLTHIRYDPNQYKKKRRRSPGSASTAIATLQPTSSSFSILRDNFDGLPSLPVDDAANSDIRMLFHRFFGGVFEHLAGVFRGPSVADMDEYKRKMLTVALDNKAYCMALISQADTDLHISRGDLLEEEKSLSLYTKTLTLFRNQLVAVHQSRNPFLIELGLLIICTLCAHDFMYSRDKALAMHWDGLQRLVKLRGGIHCVTVSLAYVVVVDRFAAIYLRKMPAFINPSNRTLQLPWERWTKYGSTFLKMQQDPTVVCDNQVLIHCIQTSCLVEIWEQQNGVREPRNGLNSSTSPELAYFVRDGVDERFAILHASLANQETLSKCILLAVRCIEYPICWQNYLPTQVIRLCEELAGILQDSDRLNAWARYSDLITWILFAMVTTPSNFKGRHWVISQLKTSMRLKYGSGEWPEMWWLHELENLRTFVWSDVACAQRFKMVCAELQKTSPVMQPVLRWAEVVTTKTSPASSAGQNKCTTQEQSIKQD